MAKSGISRANENRAIRREALREELSNKGLVNHVLDIAQKLQNLDIEIGQTEVTRLKAAADLNLSLIKKYLPDIKAVEVAGEDGGPLEIVCKWQEE